MTADDVTDDTVIVVPFIGFSTASWQFS